MRGPQRFLPTGRGARQDRAQRPPGHARAASGQAPAWERGGPPPSARPGSAVTVLIAAPRPEASPPRSAPSLQARPSDPGTSPRGTPGSDGASPPSPQDTGGGRGEGTGFKLRVLSYPPSSLPLPASQQLSGQKEAALRTGATSTLRKAGSPSQGTPTSGHLSPWTQRNIWNVSHQTGLPWLPWLPAQRAPGRPRDRHTAPGRPAPLGHSAAPAPVRPRTGNR